MTTPAKRSRQTTDNASTPQKSWRESFANAAKSSGVFTAKFGILVGTFLTGAGLAFTLTNIHNKNEKQIIDSVTSSNPSAPIMLSPHLQIIPSDTSLMIISHGIPCEIPLEDPSVLDITLGNTGEATVSEATSILQTLGITSDSRLTRNPADNAEAILRLRYEAAAACRADILQAQELAQNGIAGAAPALAENTIDYPYTVPENE